MRARIAWAALFMSMMAPPTALLAQSIEQQASALAHQLMSPYCPGLLLSDCRSEGARELRTEILQRMQAGEEADSIESDLVTRFGPSIRTEPAFSGIGLVAWLSPFVFAIAGLGLVILVVRRAAPHNRSAGTGTGFESENNAEMSVRLQDELDALD
jgi:cytochrome c-type biogenesis protein CcmH/NrfF